MGSGHRGHMRLMRLVLAALLIPLFSTFAYLIAVGWNLDTAVIDNNGGGVGILLMVIFVFVVARVADTEDWVHRGFASIALATAYFALTWRLRGGVVPSPDPQPYIVWLGLCLAAFSPVSIIMSASTQMWAYWRDRGTTTL